MSSLWKIESENRDGHWEMYVHSESPFEALRLATEEKPWDALSGISIKGVLDFIDGTSPTGTEEQTPPASSI